jgi:hypothetical protein
METELTVSPETFYRIHRGIAHRTLFHLRVLQSADWPPEDIQRDARELYDIAGRMRVSAQREAANDARVAALVRKFKSYEARILHLL